MTKTKTRALPDMRPAFLTFVLLIAVLLLSACQERRSERVAFDGVFFRASSGKVDKQRDQFEIGVSPVSASLEGAREAGRYEAVRYCIKEFGSSDITWIEGPDAEDGRLRISGDKLLLRGTCTPV
ncbi:hypothetical protein GCM10007385_27430 [Tateyamaria omphalii]|uniref:hypothetical protein n=1 Tax=Tateyamaria omphalii TaxID=299262 RepID=UPI0019B4235A|nr:hypothetical protein [Tateyamaria omphalii]GGX57111.1 hypothetical protein GCM10007385_27430 [Tateyamaria omphalii]